MHQEIPARNGLQTKLIHQVQHSEITLTCSKQREAKTMGSWEPGVFQWQEAT